MLWSIAQDRLPELQSRIRARQRGEAPPVRQAFSLPQPMRRLADFNRDITTGRPQQRNGIALLQLEGILEWQHSFFFGTSISDFLDKLAAAIADPAIAHIVLMINSPGGEITGVREAAQAIFKARGGKAITAYVSAMAASAAYWIASAAGEVCALPSAQIGAIGCYSVLFEESAALEKTGVKPYIWADPPAKVDLSGLMPPSKETQQIEQASVSRVYADFLADVSRFRGVSKEKAATRFGGGLTITGNEALAVGAVDRLCTPSEFAATLISGEQTRMAKRATNAGLRAQLQRKTAIAVHSCQAFGRRGRRHHA